MSSQNKTPKKINKSFLVVGTKEIQKFNLSNGVEEPQLSFIQNVGIFITNLQAKKDHLELMRYDKKHEENFYFIQERFIKLDLNLNKCLYKYLFNLQSDNKINK